MTATCLGLAGVFLLLQGLFPSLRNRGQKRSWQPYAFLLVYGLLLTASAFFGSWSKQLNDSGQRVTLWGARRYEGLFALLLYMTIFFLMSMHEVKWSWVLHGASITLGLFATLVVLQYMNRNPLGLFPGGRSIYTNYEFQGTIGNIDMVSGYLCLVVPLLLGGFLLGEDTPLPARVFWLLMGGAGVWLQGCIQVESGLIALGLLAMLVVLLSLHQASLRSRGCVVLAAMTLALFLRRMVQLPWLDGGAAFCLRPLDGQGVLLLLLALLLAGSAGWLRCHSGRDLPWKRLLPVIAMGLVCAVLLLLLLPLTPEMGGLYEAQQVLKGRGADDFGSYRLGVWRHTLHLAKEAPWLGNGPDTFWYAFWEHLQAEGVHYPERFDNPHNEYLAILVNSGLPALLCYLGLVISILWQGFKAARSNPLRGCGLLAIGCYACQGFFCFSICITSPMFWCVMGMVAAPFHAKTEI